MRLIIVLSMLAASFACTGTGSPATLRREAAANDSGYAGVQTRGQVAMGVDQYTSSHIFEPLPRGVPGTDVMAAKRTEIAYTVEDLPRGAALRIHGASPAVVLAIHEFLAFQGRDHHASGHYGN